METIAIEKVINYYSSLVTALPIGGYGVKVLHDALIELAALKTAERQPTAPNTGSPKCAYFDPGQRCVFDSVKECDHAVCYLHGRTLRASA